MKYLLFCLFVASCSYDNSALDKTRVQKAVIEITRHCKAAAGANAKINIFATQNRIEYRCDDTWNLGSISVNDLPVIFYP